MIQVAVAGVYIVAQARNQYIEIWTYLFTNCVYYSVEVFNYEFVVESQRRVE